MLYVNKMAHKKKRFVESPFEVDITKRTGFEFAQRGNTIRVLEQRGKTNVKRDIPRGAKLPGKRISKSGKTYWETRKNRSDAPFSSI